MSGNLLSPEHHDHPSVVQVSAFDALVDGATELFQYHVGVVSGLLQRPAYAQAILDADPMTFPPDVARYLIRTRQERLGLVAGGMARICLYENVDVASDDMPAAVIAETLEHAAGLSARRPNLDVRIVTQDGLAAHPDIAAIGMFTVVERPPDRHGVTPRYAWTGLDTNNPAGKLVIPTLVAAKQVLFHEIALPPDESVEWLQDHAADLRA